MISEVLNSLWMTYVASEYLIFESVLSNRRGSGIVAFLRARGTALGIFSTFVLFINILDHHHLVRLPGAASARKLFKEFRSVAKIGFAVSAYLLGLYCDVHRLAPLLTVRQFAGKISWALLRHAPAYPLLAVLISFGFLFVITIWDMVGLPDEWLNAPIYYGTLYGPLAVLYVTVKRQVVYESTSLPV
jgi:hypothetical protein